MRTIFVRECKQCGIARDFTQYPHESICLRCRIKNAKKAVRKPRTEEQKFQARLKQYGITQQEYDTTLLNQNESCAICETKQDLVFDHDHTTGQFRGLLCQACNVGIGFLNDDPKRLTKAIEYIQGSIHL